MSMKRTPEWYAEYQARRIKQIGKVTSGGVDGHAAYMAPSPQVKGQRAPMPDQHGAGIESGPLTNIEFIGDGAIRKDAQAAVRAAGTAASPPIYPLVALCRAAGLPEPIPEYQFHPRRKWRFDYCFPAHKLALEVDGGVWTQGRHTRGSGRVADMEKQSEAAILGYRILYVTPEQVSNGAALDYVQRALRLLEFVA